MHTLCLKFLQDIYFLLICSDVTLVSANMPSSIENSKEIKMYADFPTAKSFERKRRSYPDYINQDSEGSFPRVQPRRCAHVGITPSGNFGTNYSFDYGLKRGDEGLGRGG